MNTEYELYAKAAIEEFGILAKEKVNDTNVENVITIAESSNNFELTSVTKMENTLISENESEINHEIKYEDVINSQDLKNKDNVNDTMSPKGVEASFNCSFCGKEYTTSSDLEKHLQIIHTNIDPGIGEVKSTTQASDLSTLVRTHAHIKEKPYECEYCGNRFGDIITFKIHAIARKSNPCIRGKGKHSGPIKRKNNKWNQMQCNKCQLYFWRSGDLERHNKLHDVENQQLQSTSDLMHGQLTQFSNQFLVSTMRTDSVEFQEVTGYDLENLDNIIIKEEPYDENTEFVYSYEENNDFSPDGDAAAMVTNIRSRWARIMYERV